MDDLLSEKEQIEQIRAWWSENGRYVIGGVVIAVALLIGFNQYESRNLSAQTEASELYEQLAVAVDDGETEAAEQVAEELTTAYADTSYAAQANLALARLYMDKNRDEDAAVALRELLTLDGDADMQHIGRQRLAQILLYQDKAQDAIDLIEENTDPAFAALNQEILGDAFAALGRIDEAAAAYRAALAAPSQVQTIDRNFVQMKLTDLPALDAETVEPADADTEDSPVAEAEAGAAEETEATEPGEASATGIDE